MGLFGWWIIILNFAMVYVWLVRREHHSWVPLVGGFLACFGMLACPLTWVQKLAWIPLAVDCGYVVVNLTCGCGIMLIRFLRGTKDDV